MQSPLVIQEKNETAYLHERRGVELSVSPFVPRRRRSVCYRFPLLVRTFLCGTLISRYFYIPVHRTNLWRG